MTRLSAPGRLRWLLSKTLVRSNARSYPTSGCASSAAGGDLCLRIQDVQHVVSILLVLSRA
jgi:hypothetical protein